MQKYGGVTVETPQKIKEVAKQIAAKIKSSSAYQVVAIVSAMGQTTNQLIKMAQQVADKPSRRELDMLLTTGERVSMSLLSMALQAEGIAAISYTGSQAGILTDDSHVNANILDVKAFRVSESLAQGKCVVLAGFQGVSPVTKEITTLGRGGTDTTAVAMSIYLQANHCEILKDVPSVFSADPRIVVSAKSLPEISYPEMLDMTFWGAKVMHYRSVELAARHEMPVYVGPAHQVLSKTKTNSSKTQNKKSSSHTKSPQGTWIRKGVSHMFERPQIVSVNSHESVFKISCKNLQMSDLMKKFESSLAEKEISFPQILQVETGDSQGQFDIFLTAPSEILSAIKNNFTSHPHFKVTKDDYCSVTATGVGTGSADLNQKLLAELAKVKVPIEKIIYSAMSVGFLLAKSNREKAIKAIHSLI